MKLLKSEKLKLPKIFYVSVLEDIKKLPIGVPFIFGDKHNEQNVIRLLEYEVLYQKALRTGYPFNFRKILEDNGYTNLLNLRGSNPLYGDYVTEELLEKDDESIKYLCELTDSSNEFLSTYIRDASAYVDIQKLKDLNVFPLWLDDIEKAVNTNIHNFAAFDNNMYNKKLEGMYGGLDFKSPKKNLIIIDISSSIPKAVSTTCLVLSKNLCENFYADLLITGSKSTLYDYSNLHELDIETVYKENGEDNDQVWFKNLVTSEVKEYKTAIVFGDNHSPCQKWHNRFNSEATTISREDGKKMCKWKINHLISFHTSGTTYTAGYADWFSPETVEKINNWVKYLN
jgi:hypothetical protein